jgi:RNA polymerase sporulation-specific sigma factor
MAKNYYRLLTDDELFKLLKNDRNAENEFYRRYKSIVKSIMYKYKIFPIDRDDLIQEGMIGLFQAIETYDTSRRVMFSTYANVCIRNRIKNAIDSFWQHRKNIDKEQDIEEIISFNNPENDTIFSEYSEFMKKGLQNLTELEQKVLERYIENKSYKTIASELEISSKKVDNILVKIRLKLSAYLKGMNTGLS